MAKGRKLTASRSERLLGSYSYGQSHGATMGTDVSELGEEDVWSMMDDMASNDHHNSQSEWSSRADSIMSSRRRRGGNHVGGLSMVFDDSVKTTSPRILHQYRTQDGGGPPPRTHNMANSAPVNVPDWSKILRVNSVESLPDSDDGLDDHDLETMPPHVYLARNRNTTTTSVCEGVGRTLKGRDMRRVRDAVWSQTGFYG